jgi:hypothetical protein
MPRPRPKPAALGQTLLRQSLNYSGGQSVRTAIRRIRGRIPASIGVGLPRAPCVPTVVASTRTDLECSTRSEACTSHACSRPERRRSTRGADGRPVIRRRGLWPRVRVVRDVQTAWTQRAGSRAMERRRLERPTSSLQSWQPHAVTPDSTGTCEPTPDAPRACPSSCGQNGHESGDLDADLAVVVEEWASLPEPIKRAVVAMVEASGK